MVDTHKVVIWELYIEEEMGTGSVLHVWHNKTLLKTKMYNSTNTGIFLSQKTGVYQLQPPVTRTYYYPVLDKGSLEKIWLSSQVVLV